MTPPTVRFSFVCAVFAAAMACAAAVPVSTPPTASQQPQPRDDARSATGGLGSALWSVFDGCLAADSAEPATVCLKSKALAALDRAIAKPTVVIAEGVSLSSRAGRSLRTIDPSAGDADRAALEAASDPDHKSALLDDMLVKRLDELVSTKGIVLDGSAVQEGRGRKKEQKAMMQAVMMAGTMAVAVLGPLSIKFIALLAAKALLIGKIALLLAGILSFKSILQPQQSSKPVVVEKTHYYDYNSNAVNYNAQGGGAPADAHDWAYAGQKQ